MSSFIEINARRTTSGDTLPECAMSNAHLGVTFERVIHLWCGKKPLKYTLSRLRIQTLAKEKSDVCTKSNVHKDRLDPSSNVGTQGELR